MLAIAALAALVIDGVARLCHAQPPVYGASDLSQWKREADFPFSLSRPDDVDRLSKIRNIAVLEATITLEKFSRQELTNDHAEPRRAVQVLVMYGGGGARGLKALCDNILTVKYGQDEAGSPLRDFIAAQALVTVGGPRVRTAVFESLRQPLVDRGLLIRAHVLAKMEPPSVMGEYLRLALEDQEEREKIRAVRVDDSYKSRLELMNAWIRNPVFLRDQNNWP